MTDYIEKINSYIESKKSEGYSPMDAIMELATLAGMEWFNPYKATDNQLQLLAMEI